MKKEIEIMLKRAEEFIKDAEWDFQRGVYDLAKIYKFVKKNKNVLRNLENAYIAARYLPEFFDEIDVKEAFEVYKELRRLLWNF